MIRYKKWAQPCLLGLVVFVAAISGQAKELTAEQVETNRQIFIELKENSIEMESEFSADKDFAVYEKEYIKALRALPTPKSVSRVSLNRRVQQANVVLLADYHMVKGSQKKVERVLERMAKGGDAPALVLEWIDKKFEKEVQRYMRSEIKADTLRQRINYDMTWGFDWAPHLAILDKAKEVGARIILPNTLTKNLKSKRRDVVVAKTLKRDLQKNPNSRYLIVYGELHTLGNHMGARLSEVGLLPDLVLLSKVGKFYWKALKNLKDTTKARTLQFNERIYFLANGDPLTGIKQRLRYIGGLLDEMENVRLIIEDVTIKWSAKINRCLASVKK